MKKETTMTKTTELIDGTTFTVKVLKTRGPRKGETWTAGRGAQGAALGQVGTADRALGHATGKGKTGTLTAAAGLGATGVTNLDAVKARYARVKGAENREAAREEAAQRRAAREAEAFAALDALLAGL